MAALVKFKIWTGGEIYINPDHVTEVRSMGAGGGSQIILVTKAAHNVEGAKDEVAARLTVKVGGQLEA